MANFLSIEHQLEGALNNQLTLARTNQGVWEWFNALKRIVSANRVTETPRVFGPRATTGATDIDVSTTAGTVWGILIDNSMSAEDTYVSLYNSNTVTLGTTDSKGYYWGERNKVTTHVFADGIPFATAISVADGIGTEAGLEAGTASTTAPTVIILYSN